MNYFKPTLILILSIITLFVNAQKVVYNSRVAGWENNNNQGSDIIYSVFLIGDTKYPSPDNEVLNLLQNKLNSQSENSALVVLGDIVYNYGLPDSLEQDYQIYADTLSHILKSIENFKGQIVFVPGNHDWEQGKSNGLERLNNLEKYIENYLGRGNVFLPDDGCPGPVEINLSDDITLVVFDTQWWFHKFDKPGFENDCGFEDENGMITEIEDILRRNKDKKTIFAAHHPLYSVGVHGGNFPFSSLLFPFLEKNKNLFIPAPGFIYTSHRKFFGDIQDFAHPEYKLLKDNLLNILKDYPDMIYAAGHEHNLQYVEKNRLHHIISGGGGEATYIAQKKNKTDFAAQATGFSILNFYENGDVWIEFLSPDETDEGKILFRKKLYNKPVYSETQKEVEFDQIDFSDSIVYVEISKIYEAGKFRRHMMGDNYREVWNTKVNFPVFDIGTEKGGLSIIKRGGGMQTRSIRMENQDGKQYVLRSVNKYVESVLPRNLRNTIALDIIQDGISASFPYAAITVPIMADAIGVLHTNPKFVWVPDDPRFGIYREDLANGVFLFEERASGNWKDLESFGNSKEIINTDEVMKNIYNKHDHNVDQPSVLKSRLFDLFINDWDRHDDQWRWASYKGKGKTNYRPIPRDRDQVYFVNQGVLPKIASRTWMTPKFQDFDEDIRNVVGLSDNARFFDRSFLNETDLDDWIEMADFINNQITESIIHAAIKKLPEEVYSISGEEIENKLISRKGKLPVYAKDLYLSLAKAVDIVGTNDREFFQAKRLENGNVDLSVTALSDKKGKEKEQLFHREFVFGETKEIRLYGLNDKDKFVVEGEGDKGIKIRIIGGSGNDSITDNSKVSGLSKKTIIYDRKDKKNSIQKGSETKLYLSNKKSVNNYNRKQFKRNITAPLY
ncbi:MAG: metallophosphoesterase, partial [Mariniphaga sp.]|nr:metallophosphoesterase [Mariniphaga sp.]